MKRLLTAALACSLLLTGCCQNVTYSTLPPEDWTDTSASEPENGDVPADASTSVVEKSPADASTSQPEQEVFTPFHYTLCFAGDVSLANGGSTVLALEENGLEWCFGKKLLKEMQNADLLCLNAEFAFTNYDTPLNDKTYTFRSKPERISVLQELGVDVAVLANNHVFDFCEQGLLDTLDTYQNAGIPYIGAGRNLEEASGIYYAQLEGCTVAYIAGSRVEWSMLTRGAKEDLAGVFRTADSNELMVQRIKEAREHADLVVVYQHWGQEGTTELEDYQTKSGREFIDAGADMVIGDHPHVVQGVEWYNGKPIIYSMGNYWFTSRQERYTMLLEAEVNGDESGVITTSYHVIPAWTSSSKVRYLSDEGDRKEFYRYLTDISVNGSVDNSGKLVFESEE